MIEFIIEILTYQAEGVNYAIAPAAFLIPGALQALGGLMGGKARRKEAAAAKAEYKASRQDYLDMNMTNPYENMTNAYENLQVNTQEADYMQQQQMQGSANIMDALSGAAGSSGIASLAQSLANQNTMAAQQSAASIGKQEAMNQKMRAQGQMQIDQLKGQGDQFVQQHEKDKTETLFGMSQSRVTASNQAIQHAKDQVLGGIGSMGSAMVGLAGTEYFTTAMGKGGGGFWGNKNSDRRLKKNINLIGKSPSGINIYNFEYINKDYGSGVYQGVMSDEAPREAVSVDFDGYDMVDYSILDVQFKQI